MLEIIEARAGGGKSHKICEKIRATLLSGKKAYYIVPPQDAVAAERRITLQLSDIDTLGLEVLNFSRLPNFVGRCLGDLSYHLPTKGICRTVLWSSIGSVKSQLKLYSETQMSDTFVLDEILGAINDCKMYNITAEKLIMTSEKTKNTSEQLSNKLSDIALICQSYESELEKKFDNPQNELNVLANKLKSNSFFAGSDVYFDGFIGFTPQQFSVFEEILRQADNVCISLCRDADRKCDLFAPADDFMSRLMGCAGRVNSKVALNKLEEKNYRASNDEIAFVEAHLFRDDGKVYADKPSHIHAFFADDAFDEAEKIATDICQKIRCGYKFSDFAVAIRGIERYSGIIDAVFKKYDIPYFMSKREDVKTTPLVSLIQSAFSIYCRNYKIDDILSYIKTGLCGIDGEECFLLENYIATWNISGRRFISGDFNYNPDGFVEEFSDGAKVKLEKINEIRKKVVDSLSDLFATFSSKTLTVKTISEAVYSFLSKTNASVLNDKSSFTEQTAEKLEFATLWRAIVSALDELVCACCNMPCSVYEYSKLFLSVLSDADYGKIPSCTDQVLITEATTMRAYSTKVMYIPGVSEGDFPLCADAGGIFDEYEYEILRQNDVDFSNDIEMRQKKELFYFYLAASAASEELIVSYNAGAASGKKNMPSVAIIDMQKIMPKLDFENASAILPSERIFSQKTAFEAAAAYNKTENGALIKKLISDETEMSKLDMLSKGLINRNIAIDKSVADDIFGGDIYISHSRLDSYTKCRFAYYLKYILRLSEKPSGAVQAVDVGNFVHKALETTLKKMYSDKKFDEVYGKSGENIASYLKNFTADYSKKVLGVDAECGISAQMERLSLATELVIHNIVDEFKNSNFKPLYYEVKIGGKDSEYELNIPLDDGCFAHINGKVDRVDEYDAGNDKYIKVVDYKTGNKKFDINKIKQGSDMQLIIYLGAMCRGKKDGKEKRLPAGACYHLTSLPSQSLYFDPGDDAAYAGGKKSLKRDGLYLNDTAILKAIDSSETSEYTNIKFKKNGDIDSRSFRRLASGLEFEKLFETCNDNVKKIVTDLKSGNASARGFIVNDGKVCDVKSDCEYCKMKNICRLVDKRINDECEETED